MSNEADLGLARASENARRPEAAEFQEAPGEAEAEAAREAYLQSAGADTSRLLPSLDPAARAQVIHRLQRERGNAYVQRVLAEERGAAGRLVGLSQPEMVDEVQRRKGGGSPLPEETRSQMEGFFGADLGNVRVHADGEATRLNRELDAQAFTVGSDVFFDEGKYDPSSREGQGLLAHELTHVGQQGGFAKRAEQEAIQRAVVERAPAAQADQVVTKEGDSAAQGMAESVDVQIGDKNTVADRTEARRFIDLITAAESTVTKAQNESSDVRDKYEPVTVNTQTRFALQQYESTTTIAGGAISQFQSAYHVAAEDYGRVMGMSGPALKALGMDPSKVAGSTSEAVTKKLATPATAHSVDALTKHDNALQGHLEDWKKARQDVVTASSMIPAEKAAVEGAMNAYQAHWFEAQAAAAGAQADDAKAEIESIKKEIAETAETVGKVFQLASMALGNLEAMETFGKGLPDEKAIEDIPKELQKEIHSPEDLKKQIEGIAGKIDNVAGKIPGIGNFKATDLLDPDKVVEMIGNAANEDKITALETKIKQNEKLKSLNGAAAAVIKASEPARVLKIRGNKLAGFIKTYIGARKRLDTLTNTMAQAAAHAGNPQAAMAFRFVAEAEKGVASCDLAIKYGEDEQARGKEALDQRKTVQEGATSGGQFQLYNKYYTAQKIKMPWYESDIWRVTRHDIELQAQGGGSLTDSTNFAGGTASDSAQTAIIEAIGEVKQWKAKLADISGKIADAIGMPTPGPSQAQTPTPT